MLLGCAALLSGCGAGAGDLQSQVSQGGQDGKGDPKPPPPPPPPPGMCFSGNLGDGKTCVDPGTLKMDAATLCASKKTELQDLQFIGPCMGGFTQAKYTCCSMAPPPPPPPGKCFGGTLGEDGSSCKDPASWEMEVAGLCAAAGTRIDHLSLSNDCGKGQFSFGEYQCCP